MASFDVMPEVQLYQPAELGDALNLADELGEDGWLLGGGQDTYGWLKDRAKQPTAMIDLNGIEALRGIRDTDDGPSVGSSSHHEFLTQLTMPGDDWLERFWNPTLLIQGRIAVVWTQYDFYRNGQFSHCGIDAFSLLKTADGWKIAGTTYTAETTGCPESPLGPPR